MSETPETETIEVTARCTRVKGTDPDTGEPKWAGQHGTVAIPAGKAATLRRQGKAREYVELSAEYQAAQNALEADDFQDMRRAASTLGLDVGSTPDKPTLKAALTDALEGASE